MQPLHHCKRLHPTGPNRLLYCPPLLPRRSLHRSARIPAEPAPPRPAAHADTQGGELSIGPLFLLLLRGAGKPALSILPPTSIFTCAPACRFPFSPRNPLKACLGFAEDSVRHTAWHGRSILGDKTLCSPSSPEKGDQKAWRIYYRLLPSTTTVHATHCGAKLRGAGLQTPGTPQCRARMRS